MKTINVSGRSIKPLFIFGEDIKTNEVVLCNPEAELTPKLICYFFLVIASLNRMTPEEFAPLIVRGANRLLEEDPALSEKIRSSRQ